jgi:hypothetical protein
VVYPTSAGGGLILFYLYDIQRYWNVSDTDAQTITMLVGGLGGFMIAIPLFLKDLHRGSSFWKQFFVIALVFILTSAAGVFSFLAIEKSVEIRLHAWFAIGLMSVFSTNAFVHATKLFNKRNLRVRFDPELTMVLSLMGLITGVWMAPSQRLIQMFLLLAIYGLYLTILLMLAVLVQMISNLFSPQVTNVGMLSEEQQIKWAIQNIALEHKDTALTEQKLIDYLRKESFPRKQEIINPTIVETLVAEMDTETEFGRPMVTLTNDYGGFVIPRWQPEYDQLISSAAPLFIAITADKREFNYNSLGSINTWEEIKNNNFLCTTLYGFLSKGSGLSVELLKDNDSLPKKFNLPLVVTARNYNYFDKIGVLFVPKNSDDNFVQEEKNRTISIEQLKDLYDKNTTSDLYADEEMTANLNKLNISH